MRVDAQPVAVIYVAWFGLLHKEYLVLVDLRHAQLLQGQRVGDGLTVKRLNEDQISVFEYLYQE